MQTPIHNKLALNVHAIRPAPTISDRREITFRQLERARCMHTQNFGADIYVNFIAFITCRSVRKVVPRGLRLACRRRQCLFSCASRYSRSYDFVFILPFYVNGTGVSLYFLFLFQATRKKNTKQFS